MFIACCYIPEADVLAKCPCKFIVLLKYVWGNSTVTEVQIRQQIQSYVDPLRCNFLN